MHPSERIRGERSRILEGKRVVLAVTGSIAAVRTVELARELVRHGADVLPVMTDAAARLVGPDALEFATGHRPVTRITGAVEHVRDKDADVLLVAPASGNTVSKMALGIDDTTVTTYFTARPKHLPTLVAPAMHDTMWDSPPLKENVQRLKDMGVTVIDPVIREEKAKLADPADLVEHVLRAAGPRTLAGKRVLVINGSTVEPIDEMRVVTNKSTGRTGVELAREAFRLGADVEHWFGHGHVADFPQHVPTRRFVTVDDLVDMTPDLARFDAVLMPAAISDFGPAPSEGKRASDVDHLTLELQPLPKVVRRVREAFDGTLVAFKAESGVDEKRLVAKARESVEKNGAAFVVANDLRGVDVDRTSVLLVDARSTTRVDGAKEDVARRILDRLAEVMARE